MLDQQKWTPLSMPAEAIERIIALAQNGQIGINFTNMWYEEYPDNNDDAFEGNDDSDHDDPDCNDHDDSSQGDDDDYDDFIAGVNGNNLVGPDLPGKE